MAQPNPRWASHPRGPYIRLQSGRKFFLQDPKAEDMSISDIAYHTARINRYTGGSDFSVAQHMVVGARMAERFYPEHPLLPSRFLIHDAAEFAFGDMSSPLKHICPEYKALINAADLEIERRFDLTFVGDPLVKELDVRMWLTERQWVYIDSDEDIAEDYDGPLEPFDLSADEWLYQFGYWGADLAEDEWKAEIVERQVGS